MTKKKRGEERNESSVQVALGELMGLEEERQSEERAEAQRRAEEERRRRAEEERRRAEEERRRRAEAEAKQRAELAARAEEERERQRAATEREIRIRAEAEASLRAEEQRLEREHALAVSRMQPRRRIPVWLAPAVAALSLGATGLLAAQLFSIQSGAAVREAEAERARTNLKLDLERELDAARAARLNAITELEAAQRRFEDERRQLKEKCDAVALMNRPSPKPRPTGASGRPGAQGAGLEDFGTLGPTFSDDPLDDSFNLKGSKKDKKKQP